MHRFFLIDMEIGKEKGDAQTYPERQKPACLWFRLTVLCA